MSTVKSIFSSLGRFLEKARAIMLNLATAIVLIFFLQSSSLERLPLLDLKLKIQVVECSLLILLELWLIKRCLTQIFCRALVLTHQWIKFKQEILFN